MIKKINNALSELIFFCIETDSTDALEAEGIPIERR